MNDYNLGTNLTTARATTKNTGLVDGNNLGLGSSRWGLRGTEDLGGGLKANFQFEQRFSINNGMSYSARDFHGRAIVGLSGDFGRLDLGREYTPSFAVSMATDVDEMSSYSLTSPLGGVRRDNAITYTTPNFSGFSAKVQLAPNKTVTDADAGISTKNNGAGFNVAYGNGPVYVGLGYETDKLSADLVGSSLYVKNSGWILGGTYDLGVAKLLANYTTNKTSGTNLGSTDIKLSEYNLGVLVPMGNISFLASLGKTKVDVNDASAKSGTEWLLGVNYSLSKRTTVFARAGKNASVTNTVGQTLTTSMVSASETKRAAIGLAHTF